MPGRRGGAGEAYNQYKHSIKLLQRGFWTVSWISSAGKERKSRRRSKYGWRGGKQTIQSAPYSAWRSTGKWICKKFGFLSLSESQHGIALAAPKRALSYVYSKKALSSSSRCSRKRTKQPPHMWRWLQASWISFCSVPRTRQPGRKKRCQLSVFLIATFCPHKHLYGAQNSLRGGTGSTCHIKLKCSEWNIVWISTRASLAYRSDVASERKIQWFSS